MFKPEKTSPLKHRTLPLLSCKGLVLGLVPRSCSSDAARWRDRLHDVLPAAAGTLLLPLVPLVPLAPASLLLLSLL
jgi:hypothetical protein